MEETRKIGDYSVKYSMYIGHKDIALGENPNADKDERYMCCFVETNAIFERYSGVLVSDDFAEIAKVFGQRVADAAEEIIQENERACQEVGINEELMAESCAPVSYKDSIENKVVVIKGSILRPEFRHANHQLICSDETGYYYADNQKEINTTVYRLNELVTKVSNARTGLLFASILGENAQTVEVTIKVR